jgi:hypothetical protein
MKIKPITAEAAAPTSSGAGTTVSGSTCVMAWNSLAAGSEKSVTVETGAFGVASVTISAAGTGYSAGILTATGGGGTGFSGAITVGGSGEITAATVTNAGQGYTSAPTIVINDASLGTNAGGGNATLVAVLGTAVVKGSFDIDGKERVFIEKGHSDKMYAEAATTFFTGVANQ